MLEFGGLALTTGVIKDYSKIALVSRDLHWANSVNIN